MFKSIFLFTLVFFISGFSAAKADVIYDNFGPGDSYSTTSAFSVGRIGTTLGLEIGIVLPTFNDNYLLDSIDVAISQSQGTGHRFSLYSVSGGLPDTLIESVLLSSLPSSLEVVSVDFSGTSLLQSNQNYAIVGHTIDDGVSRFIWGRSTEANNYVFRTRGMPWDDSIFDSPVIRVNGSVSNIPEPSAFWALLGFSFVLVLARTNKPE